LFLRRNVLNSDNFDEEPVYGKDLIPTSYAAVQARRDAIGSALLGLERSGRLTSAPTEKHPVSPPEITFPNIPSFGNENRAKNGARRGWAVGVWSKNREEWQVVDIAAQSYGLVSVSLYETLGPDVGKYM
jgi:long-chain acyl-CoA synthetase